MCPMDQVMSIAFRRGTLALSPLAVLVAGIQRTALGTLDRPLRAADVDHDRVLHQDPRDAAVAGPALHRLGGNWDGELGLRARRTDEADESLDRARHLHLDR